MKCYVSFEEIADYVDGRLDDQEVADLRHHLASGCAKCTDSLNWLRATLPRLAEVLRETNAAEQAIPLPDPTLLRAVRIQKLLPATGDFSYHFAEPAPMPLSVSAQRGFASASQYQAFDTPQHRVTVWDEPDSGANRYLIGQVFDHEGKVVQSGVVRLMDAHGGVHVAEQEGSEFHLASVPPGSCVIACELTGECLILPSVEVGQA